MIIQSRRIRKKKNEKRINQSYWAYGITWSQTVYTIPKSEKDQRGIKDRKNN